MSIPLIDLQLYFDRETSPEAFRAECTKVADSFHNCGIVLLKDPRVNPEHNNSFLDMMEKYFEVSDGIRDARPELYYQVGVTPSHRERARNYCTQMGAYKEGNKAISPCPPELDAKWRFFWRIGPQPETTKYPQLNMDPVIPPEFPEWVSTMDMWGYKMLDAIDVLAEMIAIGFNLPADAFTKLMKCGPHLLAPTGSDYSKYSSLHHVLAAYHSDLNFLTIHGKARYPGLYAWTRDGEKISVSVPDGYLLVQAGKQIEYLTAGHVLAGFHEVVITEKTLEVINKRKEEEKSLWRVSSTLFSHINSDVVLEPFELFLKDDNNTINTELQSRFPPIDTGLFVREELKAIELAAVLNNK